MTLGLGAWTRPRPSPPSLQGGLAGSLLASRREPAHAAGLAHLPFWGQRQANQLAPAIAKRPGLELPRMESHTPWRSAGRRVLLCWLTDPSRRHDGRRGRRGSTSRLLRVAGWTAQRQREVCGQGNELRRHHLGSLHLEATGGTNDAPGRSPADTLTDGIASWHVHEGERLEQEGQGDLEGIDLGPQGHFHTQGLHQLGKDEHRPHLDEDEL